MARLVTLSLAWALAPFAAEGGRIRKTAGVQAQQESQEEELEVVSIPMRVYRKDCWKRQKRNYVMLQEMEEQFYPGAGMNQTGPFDQVLKDGYYPVDCLQDYMHEFGDKFGKNKFKYNQGKISNTTIVHYSEAVPRENREKITHDVCFRFCRTIPDMYFFGIKNGNDCYCSPYYRPMAGDSDVCDAVCEGDSTLMCGSATKSSIFEMHLCAKTGKELSDAAAEMADSMEELETLSGKVMNVANGMQYAAANMQVMFRQRDWQASDQMQDVKVYAGKLINAALGAGRIMEDMSVLDGKAKQKASANFKVGKEINEAEALTAEIRKAVTAGSAAAQELQFLLAEAAPKEGSTAGNQYWPTMYFVDKKFTKTTSTCGGQTVGTPKVGSFNACAEACDFEVGMCVGFNYFSNTSDKGLCILFGRVQSTVYYPGCGENQNAVPFSGPSTTAGPAAPAPAPPGPPALLFQRRSGGDYSGDPLQTRCVVKFSMYEGTTLKPDPSGKCPMCLKKAEKAAKCYTEYGK